MPFAVRDPTGGRLVEIAVVGAAKVRYLTGSRVSKVGEGDPVGGNRAFSTMTCTVFVGG